MTRGALRSGDVVAKGFHLNTRILNLILVMFAAAGLASSAAVGCAAGEGGSPGGGMPDTGSPDDMTDAASDLDDAPEDTAEPTDLGDLEDGSADLGEEVSPVCEAGTRACVSTTRYRVCRGDGSGFDESPCPSGEQCSDGTCALPPPICMPNERRCGDFETAEVCSTDGRAWTTTSCAPGRCIEGACTSGTGDTGATCQSGADCAGGTCRCEAGACAGTPLEGGYCTTSDCDVHGCAPDELCVAFDAQRRECVRNCSGGCTRNGFACRALPTADGGWLEGCYQANAPRAVGDFCTLGGDCLGGICLHESASGSTIMDGYCSAPCASASDCPTGAACVRDAQLNGGAGFCALLCVSNAGVRTCPPERPATFGMGCVSIGRAEGGGTAQVCFKP